MAPLGTACLGVLSACGPPQQSYELYLLNPTGACGNHRLEYCGSDEGFEPGQSELESWGWLLAVGDADVVELRPTLVAVSGGAAEVAAPPMLLDARLSMDRLPMEWAGGSLGFTTVELGDFECDIPAPRADLECRVGATAMSLPWTASLRTPTRFNDVRCGTLGVAGQPVVGLGIEPDGGESVIQISAVLDDQGDLGRPPRPVPMDYAVVEPCGRGMRCPFDPVEARKLSDTVAMSCRAGPPE